MTSVEWKSLKQWFEQFVHDHIHSHPQHEFGLELKRTHTWRVVSWMKRLVQSIGLTGENRNLALAIALLHDAGRFPQLTTYGTMRDAVSENHALLGVRTLEKQPIFLALETRDQTMILTAVRNHNRKAVDDGLTERELLFCNLIRDADKLDIWHVLLVNHEGEDEEKLKTVYTDFGQSDAVNPAMIADVSAGRMADIHDIRSRSDFRLLSLSWVFDLNFPKSFQAFQQRQILQRTLEHLPSSAMLDNAVERVRQEAEAGASAEALVR